MNEKAARLLDLVNEYCYPASRFDGDREIWTDEEEKFLKVVEVCILESEDKAKIREELKDVERATDSAEKSKALPANEARDIRAILKARIEFISSAK